jgi:hypothetical protein
MVVSEAAQSLCGNGAVMAELAVRLPIFIASPSDVAAERDVAESVILSLGREVSRSRLLLQPVRWESDARPAAERPQDLINRHLRKSELVVAIFGESLGSASHPSSPETAAQEELRVALDLVSRGHADDVFVYFRGSPNGGGNGEPSTAALHQFRSEVERSKKLFCWTFRDADDFGRMLGGHLSRWLEPWEQVPSICDDTLARSVPYQMDPDDVAENRYAARVSVFDPGETPALAEALGRAAVRLYQTEGGPEAFHVPFTISIDGFPTPAHRHRNGPLSFDAWPKLRFSSPEWFFYFCAIGLEAAIKRDDLGAVSRVPYVNSVHQYLAALGRREPTLLASRLMAWLSGSKSDTYGRPIARNFAAYVLGMIGARQAEEALIAAAEQDRGKDVRMYSITSLGKLRSRRSLDALVRLYRREQDDRVKLIIGQAVCRICGIAEYEL